MAWCLIKHYADKFRKALIDRTIDPVKLSTMSSADRRSFLAEYVGAENAQNVNALFESKLLLKNQQAGMVAWAKKVVGITPDRRTELIDRIERLDRVLDPKEGEQFLADLAQARLKIEITQEEAKGISDLSRAVKEAKSLSNSEGVFPDEDSRLKYGSSKVALEEYVNELKLKSGEISFKEQPLKKSLEIIEELPSAAKSLKASLDNSFWGRQGIKVLLNTRTSGIWFKNFLKSWSDIKTELRGKDAMLAIKADIYSRPNAVNGKYKVGRYGLDVLSEEAFPSSLPEKIPLLRRLFRASESAYNGAALRLRADLADRYIGIAEQQGVNTLDKVQAEGIASVIGSMTGRGRMNLTEEQAKAVNVIFFSIKFLQSNINTLTAHMFDKTATPFARKEAAKNLLNIWGTIASILLIANFLDDDSVEEDPRSTNFGKIKMWGHWVDITGGQGSLITLAFRILPTWHNGEFGWWLKSKTGNYSKMSIGKFGGLTPIDMLFNFAEGKLSPFAGTVVDIWKQEDFQGNVPTPKSVVNNLLMPLPISNFQSMYKDPNTEFLLGSMILDGLGFSTSSTIQTNEVTQTFPVNVNTKNGDIVSYVATYAKALQVDPETAFNRIFTGQKIVRVSGDTVVVERMPLKESQEIKKKSGADNPTMKLDHTIPLELGGSNDESNLKLVTTSKWSSYTKVENALGKAIKEGRITNKDAQDLIIRFKREEISDKFVLNQIK